MGYDIAVDGIFGPGTEAAVIQFQKDNELESDGIVGQNTWHALSAKCPDISQPSTVPIGSDISQPSTVPSDSALAATDPISLDGLGGVSRTMADIYNKYGKYLKEKSQEFGISTASAAAVLKAESQGSGFGSTGKMIIRFENHVFYDNWGKNHQMEFNDHFQLNSSRRWEGHTFRASTDSEFTAFHGNQNKEWEVLEFARGLDESAALKSISMGAAQIMGFNFSTLDYSSPKEMFDDMSNSMRAQLDGMFKFISRRDECINGLRTNDFVRFAKCYNGTGQAEKYGSVIEEAASAYSNVSSGRMFQ